jgi:hypothetical protein
MIQYPSWKQEYKRVPTPNSSRIDCRLHLKFGTLYMSNIDLHKMHPSALLAIVFLAISALAKKCQNLTIPIEITARTGNYILNEPTTPLEVTTFIQNYLRAGTNYSQALLSETEPYIVSVI